MDRVLIAGVICTLSLFFMKLYHARSHVKYLQKQGLPMPPHHWLLGHLPLAAEITRSMAPYAAGGYIADQIRQRYPELKTAFYLDVWPFSRTVLAILNPDMMYQLTQQATQVPKDPGIRTFLQPLAGKENLVTMEGTIWKLWRGIFNPGFSAGHISTLVPGMVDKVLIFRNLLTEKCKTGQLFHLEDLTLNLTLDIIGGAVMDHDFQSQTKYNVMTSSLRNQLKWCTLGVEMNPLDYIKGFIRPVIYAYNTRRMNSYLDRVLRNRYHLVLGNIHNPGKSVIDLALKAYLNENPAATGIPATFRSAAMAQIKLFLFAGHDNTSTAVVFTFHLLSKHPQVLRKVREEHEAVFGKALSELPLLLKSKPHLLNQLPYTLATIKEALRLYPTVSTLRNGQSGFFLIDHNANGLRFPTEGCMIWGDHYANHHNPHIWVKPEDYLPERWLCDETDRLYPPKNAWRPFERGLRNCIGQELALTEIKLIIVLTIRKFSINDAYGEFDEVKGNTRSMTVNGIRAYMVRIGGGGHPANGYPCKVREFDGK